MNDQNQVSDAFEKLHPLVQKWVYRQNWKSFHKIQEEAIQAIIPCDSDIVISAATASGKTEAAFLPICTYLLKESLDGVGLLYISPLKALINDQFRRLESLFEIIELPLTPWHGDISAGVKSRIINRPLGGLLITPESLEALFMNRGRELSRLFNGLSFIIIDEFHSFIGSERGQQLLSLMNRLEKIIGRVIPRIALSATLGDLKTVMSLVRPGSNFPCELIVSDTLKHDIKLQLRGYCLKAPDPEVERELADEKIISDLFNHLRGSSNLLFSNSRMLVEAYSASLKDHCEDLGVRNEFFPHHGNLDKGIREDVESRLLNESIPTTAVCTSTLELGIDIGQVNSIAQVGVPPSVSSLRQRLGRSGRRGEASILRCYVSEDEVDIRSHPVDILRLFLFQSIAMVELLIDRWYEPPRREAPHFSTLVQQLLSLLVQYGGIFADQAFRLLCTNGPFLYVSKSQFVTFLRGLSKREIIKQTHDGQLILDLKGERIVGHYSFYAAFHTPEEYRLEADGKVLGTLPITFPISKDDYLIFAGKRWLVSSVEVEKKLVQLKRSVGGRPPRFGGEGFFVHKKIREQMLKLYQSESIPKYLNSKAKELLDEGRSAFQRLFQGNGNSVFSYHGITYMNVWMGDDAVFTLELLFKYYGHEVMRVFNVLEFPALDISELKLEIDKILSQPMPEAASLISELPTLRRNKHDQFVSDELLEQESIATFINLSDAQIWLNTL